MAGEDGLDRRGGAGIGEAGMGEARNGRRGLARTGVLRRGWVRQDTAGEERLVQAGFGMDRKVRQGMAWRGKEEQKQGG